MANRIINEIYRIALVKDMSLKQSWCWSGNKVKISVKCKIDAFVIPGGLYKASGRMHFTLAPGGNDWKFKDTPLHTIDKMYIPNYLM